MPKPLRIAALLDGRPGHVKQTEGILKSMEELTAIDVRRIQIYASILKRTALARRHDEESMDLVLGTGARTHLPMLLLKRRYKARAVTCMLPDLFFRRYMDLCFVPFHDRPRPGENIFVTLGPPNLSFDLEEHDKGSGLIAIGGVDEKSHFWREEDLRRQLGRIVEADPDIRWHVTSSRRTPPQTVSWLVEWAGSQGRVEFYDAGMTPFGWIEDMYRRCMNVWVTADSISMVYEAVTAGCRVGVLPVAWKKPSNKFALSIRTLAEKGWVTLYEEKRMPLLKPPSGSLNEAKRCAKEILRRWWPERLQ